MELGLVAYTYVNVFTEPQLEQNVNLCETNHLFQRLSIAIQQANAVSFTCTFKSE